MTRHSEQSVQPGDGTRGDHVKCPFQPLDLAVRYGNMGEAQLGDGSAEEVGPELAWLVQGHGPPAEDGYDQAREACSRADIKPAAPRCRQAEQLRSISDMTGPQFLDA